MRRRGAARTGAGILLVAGLAAAAAGCGDAPAEWHEAEDHRWRELRVDGREDGGFSVVEPSASGIRSVNSQPAEARVENRTLADGSGVALGDVDGDGRTDVYVARIHGPDALYRNLGGWEFEDVTAAAGVGLPGRASTGAVLADVDGDGDVDLFVTAQGGPNTLFLNRGDGTFRDATAEAGLARDDRGSRTAALADVEGDGDLDLYVANNKARVVRDLYPAEALDFEAVVRREGDEYVVVPEFRDHYRVTREGPVVERYEFAEPDEFYLNEGGGRFRAVPFTEGRFRSDDGAALPRAPDDWGLAARFQDVDGDGDPDLYVCNDFESPDRLWLNDGDGRFREAPHRMLRRVSLACMAVDFADVERDGDVDLFAAEMLSRDPRLRRTQVPAMGPEPTGPGEIRRRPQVNRNTLQLDRGDGTYAEVAWWSGVAASEWTWGAAFADVDLDGYEDLLITNGHAWDMLDADVRTGGREATDLRNRPPLRTENVAFRNLGDGRFEEATEAWGFGRGEDISHGLALGDLDGDGDLDVVVNRLGAAALVLRNESEAPRVAVVLRGRAPNTGGVGAKVRLRGGPGGVQMEEVTAGGLYLSSSDGTASFAAGEVAGEAEGLVLEVEWRSGARSVVRGVRPGRLYEIREPAPRDAAAPTAPGERDGPAPGGAASEGQDRASTKAEPDTWFEDRTEGLGHEHAEATFEEFARQPLLPYRLAQLGPGVSWDDVDRDGDPDLLVTSGVGGRLALFRNEEGELRRVPVEMPAAELDQTAVLALPSADGPPALLLGQMNYEAESPRRALEAPSVLWLGAVGGGGALRPRVTPAAPGHRASTGPLALADVDGDGDLDLFVGGRVYPTVYPVPASSRILRNEGGRLVPDSAASAPFSSVGLVSGATFADVDADGDPDLVLATEWGPVRLYLNERGTLREVTDAWGLGEHPGRWNGVTAGDLDGDGRLDLVATGWGENLEVGASAERPLRVYYDDFDRNGTFDVVEARHEPALGGIVPVDGLEVLGPAMPFLRHRVRSFADYADATVTELFGERLEGAGRAEARTLSHTLFLNRGGRFEAVSLPAEAQWAPAFHVGVADFDGDGHEDVFLTQNFFATDPRTPRHDAGRSLWLRGDGTGRLVPVPGQETGIEVYGDPRGAALGDYDADGRVDVAVSQNGAATRLYRNVGARPGLRVRFRGPPGNPDAVGSAVRVVYADGTRGPVREVRAGTGYWSRDGAVPVLGLRATPRSVAVRWPGGRETVVSVPEGAGEVTAQMPERGVP